MDTTVDDTEGRKSPEGQATAMLGRKVDSDQRWEDRDAIRTFNLVLTYLLTSVRSIFRGAVDASLMVVVARYRCEWKISCTARPLKQISRWCGSHPTEQPAAAYNIILDTLESFSLRRDVVLAFGCWGQLEVILPLNMAT